MATGQFENRDEGSGGLPGHRTSTAAQAAHTPGPWRIGAVRRDGDISINSKSLAPTNLGEMTVALAFDLWDRDGGKAGARANAHLITAAPDYDDAAHCYVRWVEAFKDQLPESVRGAMEAAFGGKLRAAIAKAERRT